LNLPLAKHGSQKDMSPQTMHQNRRSVGSILIVAAMIAVGCAGTIAPYSAGPIVDPRISWRIRTGSPGGSDREVCQSDDPRRNCVLQASTAADPRVGAVSVFLHPTNAPTTYTGAVMVGFIAGRDRLWYELNLRAYQIDPGESPVVLAAAGLVVAEPGTYDVHIALLARRPGQREPSQLSTTIEVRVDPPDACIASNRQCRSPSAGRASQPDVTPAL
jgi:hypothetical protein